MPSRRVAAELNAGTYYLALTVQRWHTLFDRYHRRQIMSGSIRYCQDSKGLELNAYVFMLNPIHLILKFLIDVQGSFRFWMETNALCPGIVKTLGTG